MLQGIFCRGSDPNYKSIQQSTRTHVFVCKKYFKLTLNKCQLFLHQICAMSVCNCFRADSGWIFQSQDLPALATASDVSPRRCVRINSRCGTRFSVAEVYKFRQVQRFFYVSVHSPGGSTAKATCAAFTMDTSSVTLSFIPQTYQVRDFNYVNVN